MSKADFPANDLLRRKMQTSLTVATLALSVASTLFLLLFSDRIGFGMAMKANVLTTGLSAVFAQFLLFVGVLIFAVGAVITSFIVFFMMKQRTRDFGLIKAAGCPNGLVFGYFMTEMFTVTIAGCALGVLFGLAADFVLTNFLGSQAIQKPANLWFIPLVFVIFFILAIFSGTKPMLDAAKSSPVKLLSSTQYFGLDSGGRLKPLSRTGITLRVASRSLFRRGSASVRIIALLSIVFILLTVSISGSIIADDTTRKWISDAVGRNIILIAQKDIVAQYRLLLSESFLEDDGGYFDFADQRYAIPEIILEKLNVEPAVSNIDKRLVLKEQIQEMAGYKIDPESLMTNLVGSNRTSESLVIGVEPEKILTKPFANGRFLNSSDAWEAVIGDTLAQGLYSPDPKASPPINLSDPFYQNVLVRDKIFDIVGVCIDPISSGNVTYVSLQNLQNVTGILNVNVVLVGLDASANRPETVASLREMVQDVNSEFYVYELDEVLQENLEFSRSMWSEIMVLPLLTSASAALCLVGYMMLGIDEQRQEFGVMRAVGVKPETIVELVSVQSVIVLFSSLAVGISLGVMITLMILMPHPVVTIMTFLQIAGWLCGALFGMFLLSLWPAVRFAKKPILKILS